VVRLPVMKNYEAGTPSYFATRRSKYHFHTSGFRLTVASASIIAPVQLIYALETSLKTIMEGKISLEERFELHRKTSVRFKTAMKDMGFKLVSRL